MWTCARRPASVAATAAAVAAIAIAGCGDSGDSATDANQNGAAVTTSPTTDRGEVEATIGAFEQAIADRDGPALCGAFAERQFRGMNEVQRRQACEQIAAMFTANSRRAPEMSVGSVRVMGNRAQAKVTTGDAELTFFLRKVGGDWKLEQLAPAT